MSIVVTELELNQYKKEFSKVVKNFESKIQYTSHHYSWFSGPIEKQKKLIEFFPPPEKQSPNSSQIYHWDEYEKKNQTTICNLFYSLFIMYEYFDNKTNWNTLYHLKTSHCMSAWKTILIIFWFVKKFVYII